MVPKKIKKNPRAIGYCRVSTTDQADFGVSLDAQTEKVRGWCIANGYELVEVMVDRGLSGGRCDNRPALQEALRTISRGDSLVVYSLISSLGARNGASNTQKKQTGSCWSNTSATCSIIEKRMESPFARAVRNLGWSRFGTGLDGW